MGTFVADELVVVPSMHRVFDFPDGAFELAYTVDAPRRKALIVQSLIGIEGLAKFDKITVYIIDPTKETPTYNDEIRFVLANFCDLGLAEKTKVKVIGQLGNMNLLSRFAGRVEIDSSDNNFFLLCELLEGSVELVGELYDRVCAVHNREMGLIPV